MLGLHESYTRVIYIQQKLMQLIAAHSNEICIEAQQRLVCVWLVFGDNIFFSTFKTDDSCIPIDIEIKLNYL